jgi:hypothetical protein
MAAISAASRRPVLASRPVAHEGPHLGRVDHRQRQAGAGDRGGHRDLEAADGLGHDQDGRGGGQPGGEPVQAGAVVLHGEAPVTGAEVDREAVLGDIDADEHGAPAMGCVAGPRLRVRAAGRDVMSRVSVPGSVAPAVRGLPPAIGLSGGAPAGKGEMRAARSAGGREAACLVPVRGFARLLAAPAGRSMLAPELSQIGGNG